MNSRIIRTLLVLLAPWCLLAHAAPPFDAATAFGHRESIEHLSLSPDGLTVSYVSPIAGMGSAVHTLGLAPGSVPKIVLTVSGDPDRVARCDWVSNQRLICEIYGVVKSIGISLQPIPFSRLIAVNADGSNLKMLSSQENVHTTVLQLGGGSIVDWLPDDQAAVLMARQRLPDSRIGSHLGSSKRGLAVDRIDTRDLSARSVEPAREEAVEFISDGHGAVRIMGLATSHAGGQETGITHYSYRTKDSSEWKALSDTNSHDRSGFYPVSIDRDLDVVYGFKKKDGRFALYCLGINGSMSEQLIYANPNVDVDDLIRIGRRRRVVGVSYASDVRRIIYFDADIEKMAKSLSAALPGHPNTQVVDSSLDESKLLIYAGSDTDPGVYYIFDRKTHQLQTFLVVRNELENVKLATMKPVTYPAADGTPIPGYLTMPPGKEDAKNLPAIVLPHGGPDARDEWGFDWLSQFYAARGFAVLRPNFRGSSGYGDAWLKTNGFKSWRIAINDVLDAGHWLVAQGIADPAQLGIVGWSYGGYAALQASATDPSLFKAVVAIAPVTDLDALKEEHRNWSDYLLVCDYVGDGPHVHEGSPADNAAKIKAPVLMFHGGMDRNVNISQSREMAARLERAGVQHELVTWDSLDHYLDDSAARTEMLSKSDAFLRHAMGMPAIAANQP